MKHDYQAYIRDLVFIFEEKAREALESSRHEHDEGSFQAGRALAYAEVLSTMQNQADSFLISRKLLALDRVSPPYVLTPDEKG